MSTELLHPATSPDGSQQKEQLAESVLFRDSENHICTAMTADDATLHINPTILEGVHHPSERAALVFTDALHAAEEYYRLFFTNVNDIEAGLRKRVLESSGSGDRMRGEEELAVGRAWVNELPGGSSDEDETEKGTKPSLHRRRTVRMMHVRNTPYHTFFPPPISGRHSRAIIRSLLHGRAPQPFADWVWGKAKGQQYGTPTVPNPTPAEPLTTPTVTTTTEVSHAVSATTTAPSTHCAAKITTVKPVSATDEASHAHAHSTPFASVTDTHHASHSHNDPRHPHPHTNHEHVLAGDADHVGADVTSLGTASDSPLDMEGSLRNLSPVGTHGGGDAEAGGMPRAASNIHMPLSARGTALTPVPYSGQSSTPGMPGRAQSEFNLATASRSRTSTRSRVESRYDRYDALAQAQATRPLSAAAPGNALASGVHGGIAMPQLPDLFKVSPTSTDETHKFGGLSHSGAQHAEINSPSSHVPGGGGGAADSAPLNAVNVPSSTVSPAASSNAGAVFPDLSGNPVAAVATPMPFDVVAINAIQDPFERARRMTELYEAVLASCQGPLLPLESPSSPVSCTSRQESAWMLPRDGLAESFNDPAGASTSTVAGTNGSPPASATSAAGNATLLPPTPFFTSSFLGENETTYMIPTSQQGPEYFSQTGDGRKPIIIIMVGLPARGKTFLAQKICRLLGWHGTKAKVHNVQVAWRRVLLDYEATRRLMTEITTPNRHATGSVRAGSPSSTAAAAASESPPCASMAPHISSPSNSTVRAFPTSEAKTDTTATTAPADADAATSATGKNPSPAHAPACLTVEHFRQLLLDPSSPARRLYRYVLRGFAEDCRTFFEGGGEVVVINDDFVTEELRLEAEALFQPYASQLFYMEVQRDEEQNTTFNECKVSDPAEYPHETVSSSAAKRDFDARMSLLQTLYETLEAHDKESTEDDDDETDDTEGGCGGEHFGVEPAGLALSGVSHQSGTGAHPHHHHPHHARKSSHTSTSGSAATPCSRRPPSLALRKAVRGRHQLRYVKVVNATTMETHGISGYTASNIVSYVLNLSQVKMQHPIYFVRHGESCYNLEDRIGGDPLLTDQGMRDSAALLEFLTSLKAHLAAVDDTEAAKRRARKGEAQQPSLMPSASAVPRPAGSKPSSVLNAEKLEIWTSQLRRAIQTAELSERLLDVKTLRWSSLNEIHAGVCEDMTYAEVKRQYPLIDHFRKQSKYTYRYPDGESYQDLVVRLEPVIMELENADKAVVVVAHQAVLRCLLAYFGSVSAESSVRMKVPHRTVWRCTYDSKGIASLEELVLRNADAGFRRVQRLPGVDDSLFVSEENVHVENVPAVPPVL